MKFKCSAFCRFLPGLTQYALLACCITFTSCGGNGNSSVNSVENSCEPEFTVISDTTTSEEWKTQKGAVIFPYKNDLIVNIYKKHVKDKHGTPWKEVVTGSLRFYFMRETFELLVYENESLLHKYDISMFITEDYRNINLNCTISKGHLNTRYFYKGKRLLDLSYGSNDNYFFTYYPDGKNILYSDSKRTFFPPI